MPVTAGGHFRADVAGVDHGDNEIGIFQTAEARRGGLPDKAHILGDIDLRKTMLLPKALVVAERVAGDPGPQPGGINVLPGVLRGGLKIVETVETADVEIVLEELRDLVGEPPGGVPIVVVPVENDVARGALAGEIALGADGVSAVEPDVADLWIVGDEVAHTVGAVVNDEKFFVSVVLAEEERD